MRARASWCIQLRRGDRGGGTGPALCAQQSVEVPAHQPSGIVPQTLFFIAGDKEVLRDEIIYAFVLFSPCFQSYDSHIALIGLHTWDNFRCVMRRGYVSNFQ